MYTEAQLHINDTRTTPSQHFTQNHKFGPQVHGVTGISVINERSAERHHTRRYTRLPEAAGA
jgi:hypothetical protein